ncbi:hypothetical protein PSV08DRAFT_22703 [Bipolaris maydis]|uniref:uncharacterized protein n=1 Tax=Cochliobolus heterostrophus TaxID=5016 RepID=UPI0024D1B3DF|nr:hypothetical protein J3E73DRAFT_27302 [Bipolaris maydis]KAJ6274221.1 hypothetical protein PSV08DRAFT_22703 [Bipolaris maydis]KAJ6286498.1 hypothetical protein J3E71DRAFT_25650 [Bipolaris maydis]
MYFKYLFAVLVAMAASTSALNICYSDGDCTTYVEENCPNGGGCTASPGACKCS